MKYTNHKVVKFTELPTDIRENLKIMFINDVLISADDTEEFIIITDNFSVESKYNINHSIVSKYFIEQGCLENEVIYITNIN